MSSVLLFEPNVDQARRMAFLVRLAGHQCTLAQSVDETVNWLTSVPYLVNGFDLLLLGSTPEQSQLKPLLDLLQGKNRIPVLCIERHGAQSPSEQHPEVLYCVPQDLITTIDECLPANDGPYKLESQ